MRKRDIINSILILGFVIIILGVFPSMIATHLGKEDFALYYAFVLPGVGISVYSFISRIIEKNSTEEEDE